MQTATIEQILRWIAAGHPFEAELPDGSLYLRADEYPPFVATAIHDGHRMRESLLRSCLLSDQERRMEEDPHTGAMIAPLPLVMIARDSRYEYDLNRAPGECLYEQAWGRQVWAAPLPEQERKLSLDRHAAFYRLYEALAGQIEQRHGRCLVFDMHSYNTGRLERDDWPHFNLGTSQVARHRFRGTIDFWLELLAGISLDDGRPRVAENDVFQGRGYLSRFTREHFRNTLVLSTELAKFFCDEKSGEPYPAVVQSIGDQLKPAMIAAAGKFTGRRRSKGTRRQPPGPDIDPQLRRLDDELYRLVGKVDILDHVNPGNQAQARREFYRGHCRRDPEFHYRPIQLDPFALKEQLYRLPVDQISDPTLQRLYRDVIDSYADKAQQLASIGSEKFLYNSLRYFGEPSERDIANARFLLHAPALPEDQPSTADIPAEGIRSAMLRFMQEMGLEGRIRISREIVATAMVSESKKMVFVKQGALVNRRSLQALVHHEIGVHLVTTRNAEQQPLKIFLLGLPLNTLTQEGLAILAEYLSGNITLKRFRSLALRVLVIKRMIGGEPFREVFHWLVEEQGFSADGAFNLATRAFRGGGFTKDYLYLRGIHDCLKAYRDGVPFDDLFIGKTSLAYLPVLAELRERGLVTPPKFKPPAFTDPQASNPIIDYIMGAVG